jgi:hypothetical protein
MKNPRKELHDIADVSGEPSLAEEEKGGLTSRQKNILENTMNRHDKAFKRLAKM